TADKLTPRQAQALEALALETFAEAGAKATQVADIAHIPTDNIFRVLSALKRLEYVKQSAKGDPYYITVTGRARLSTPKLSNTVEKSELSLDSHKPSDSTHRQLSVLSPPFRGDSDDSSDRRKE